MICLPPCSNVLQEGDVVLTMGAGSINKAAQALAEGSR